MSKRYAVIRADRAAKTDLKSGDAVFYCRGHDYGCASDDTAMTGIHHVSVTLDENGDYPFFTIPREDIKGVEA